MDLLGSLAALLSVAALCQAGEHQAICPDEKIKAVEGSEVILPCQEPRKNLEKFTLDWRNGSEVFYLYRHGQEDPQSEHEDRMRVELEGLKTGDLSLKISSVQPSDQGTYRCSIIEPGSSRTSCTVELVVVESSGGRGDDSSTAEPPVMKDGADDSAEKRDEISTSPPTAVIIIIIIIIIIFIIFVVTIIIVLLVKRGTINLWGQKTLTDEETGSEEEVEELRVHDC